MTLSRFPVLYGLIITVFFFGCLVKYHDGGWKKQDLQRQELISRLFASEDPNLIKAQARIDSMSRRIEEENRMSFGPLGEGMGIGTAQSDDSDQSYLFIKGFHSSAENLRPAAGARFDYSDDPGYGKVLIPVSNREYTTWRIVFGILMAVLALVGFVGFFANPVKILSMVAEGKAFTERTVDYLYTLAALLIGLGIFLMLFKYLLFFSYQQRIPAEYRISLLKTFQDSVPLLLPGLIIFLVAKAFHQGLNLQKEVELTV